MSLQACFTLAFASHHINLNGKQCHTLSLMHESPNAISKFLVLQAAELRRAWAGRLMELDFVPVERIWSLVAEPQELPLWGFLQQ